MARVGGVKLKLALDELADEAAGVPELKVMRLPDLSPLTRPAALPTRPINSGKATSAKPIDSSFAKDRG